MLPIVLNSNFLMISTPFSAILSSERRKQIEEIATLIFAKFTQLFEFIFHHKPTETNLKAFAMISCLSLTVLLVISLLRNRNHSSNTPSKPNKT